MKRYKILKVILCIIISISLIFCTFIYSYNDAYAILPALVIAAPEVYALCLTGLAACGVIANNPNETYSLYCDFMDWTNKAGLSLADLYNGIDTANDTVILKNAYFSYAEHVKSTGLIANEFNPLEERTVISPLINTGYTWTSEVLYNFDLFSDGIYMFKTLLISGGPCYSFLINGLIYKYSGSYDCTLNISSSTNTVNISGYKNGDNNNTTTTYDLGSSNLSMHLESSIPNQNSTAISYTLKYDVMYRPNNAESNITVPTTISPSTIAQPNEKLKTITRPITDYTVQNRDAILTDTTIAEPTVVNEEEIGFWGTVTNFITEFWTKIVTAITTGVTSALLAVTGILDGVSGILTQIWDWLKEFFSSLTGALSVALAPVIALTQSIADSIANIGTREGTDIADSSLPPNYDLPDLFWLLFILIIAFIRLVLRGLVYILSLYNLNADSTMFNQNVVSGINFMKNQQIPYFNVTFWFIAQTLSTLLFGLALIKLGKKFLLSLNSKSLLDKLKGDDN